MQPILILSVSIFTFESFIRVCPPSTESRLQLSSNRSKPPTEQQRYKRFLSLASLPYIHIIIFICGYMSVCMYVLTYIHIYIYAIVYISVQLSALFTFIYLLLIII